MLYMYIRAYVCTYIADYVHVHVFSLRCRISEGGVHLGSCTHWQGTEAPPTPSEVAINLERNKQQSKSIQHSQSDLEGEVHICEYTTQALTGETDQRTTGRDKLGRAV